MWVDGRLVWPEIGRRENSENPALLLLGDSSTLQKACQTVTEKHPIALSWLGPEWVEGMGPAAMLTVVGTVDTSKNGR